METTDSAVKPAKVLNLAGKDYFTEAEAAAYACVCPSQFRRRAKEEGIFPRTFMGKVVYRKADIQRAIEAHWG